MSKLRKVLRDDAAIELDDLVLETRTHVMNVAESRGIPWAEFTRMILGSRAQTAKAICITQIANRMEGEIYAHYKTQMDLPIEDKKK